MVLENWTATCKRMQLEHSLTPYTKINSKWIKDLNLRPKTIKLLEENISSILFKNSLSNIFLDLSPRARNTKVKKSKHEDLLASLRRWSSSFYTVPVWLFLPLLCYLLRCCWLFRGPSLWDPMSDFHHYVLWASLVAQTVKHPPTMQETRVWSLDLEDPLEREMATHSSILAWTIPWTEKPGRLQSMESQRVRLDSETNTHVVMTEIKCAINVMHFYHPQSIRLQPRSMERSFSMKPVPGTRNVGHLWFRWQLTEWKMFYF